MKLRSLKAATLALALSIAAAAPVALAQSGEQQEGRSEGHARKWRGKGRHGGFGKGMHFRGLDLTEAQQTQIRQIHESHRASIQPLREEVRAKRTELRQLTTGESFDEAAVRQKLTEIAAIEARLMGEQFRIREEMMAVLTPEQKAKLAERRAEFKNRWEERRERKARGGSEDSNQ